MATYVQQRALVLGKPIVDANKNLTITLTQRQINTSHQKDSARCAFARCCEQSVNNVEAAFFFRQSAYLEYKTKIVRYMLTGAAMTEVIVFDRGGNMQPGKYVLRAPSKAERLENKRGRDKRDRAAKGTRKGVHRKRAYIHIKGLRDKLDPSYRAAKEMGATKL